MSNKTRSVIKAISVLLVLLSVAMQLRWIIIPSLSGYVFWIIIAAFGMLLISSK
jgi:hypothetical protein